jgi:hypothetical protein
MHSAHACCYRAGELFLEKGQVQEAVRLMVLSKQAGRALELIEAHNVGLTEETAEALTPEKTTDNAEHRAGVLMRIAQVCVCVCVPSCVRRSVSLCVFLPVYASPMVGTLC